MRILTCRSIWICRTATDLVAEGFDLAMDRGAFGLQPDPERKSRRSGTFLRFAGFLKYQKSPSRRISRAHRRLSIPAKRCRTTGLTAGRTARRCARDARNLASNGDMREAAISGLGVTSLPNYMEHDAINNGLLKPVLTITNGRSMTSMPYIPRQRSCRNAPAPLSDFIIDPLRHGPLLEQGHA